MLKEQRTRPREQRETESEERVTEWKNPSAMPQSQIWAAVRTRAFAAPCSSHCLADSAASWISCGSGNGISSLSLARSLSSLSLFLFACLGEDGRWFVEAQFNGKR